MLTPNEQEYLVKIQSYNPGIGDADIRLVLRSSGWNAEKIEEGVKYLRGGPPPPWPKETSLPSPAVSPPPRQGGDLIPQPVKPGLTPLIQSKAPLPPKPVALSPALRGTPGVRGVALAMAALLVLILAASGLSFFLGLPPLGTLGKPASPSNFLTTISKALTGSGSLSRTIVLEFKEEPRENGVKSSGSSAVNDFLKSISPGSFARSRLEASYAGRDFKVELDASARVGLAVFESVGAVVIKAGKIYLRVDKLYPSALATSTILGQWVSLMPEELPLLARPEATTTAAGAGPLRLDERVYLEYLETALPLADRHRVIKISRVRRDDISGLKAYRYDIRVSLPNLISFYKEYTEVMRERYGASVISPNTGLIEFLENEDSAEVFDFWKRNSAASVWLDERGLPVSSLLTLRLVPPDEVTTLSGRQFKLTVSADVSPGLAVIQAPERFLSIEEARRILFEPPPSPSSLKPPPPPAARKPTSAVTEVKAVFEKIRAANRTQNADEMDKHLTARSVALLAAGGERIWFKDFVWVSGRVSGSRVVTEIRIIDLAAGASTLSVPFLRQGGVWKMGLAESLEL
ncbi:MAG: hypothetical protein HYT43_00100 [Candidatus Taylorbacteria bacterium]|nr:hypothetical protein [Candidatus Taylorbacteria bacterium]